MKKRRYSIVAVMSLLILLAAAPWKAEAAEVTKLATPKMTNFEFNESYFSFDVERTAGAQSYELWRNINHQGWEKIKEFDDSVYRDGEDTVTWTDWFESSELEYYSYNHGDQMQFCFVARNDTLSSAEPDDSIAQSYYVTQMPELSMSNTGTGIRIQWDKTTGVDEYRIYRGEKLIKTVSGTAAGYTDTGVKDKNHKVYYYHIVPFKNGCKGIERGEEYRRVAAPSGLKVVNKAKKSIAVSWNKVSGAKEYIVNLTCGGKSKKYKVKATSKKVQSYVLKGLTRGKMYSVKVRANNYEIYEDSVTTGEVDENGNEIYVTICEKEYPAYSAWTKTKTVKVRK